MSSVIENTGRTLTPSYFNSNAFLTVGITASSNTPHRRISRFFWMSRVSTMRVRIYASVEPTATSRRNAAKSPLMVMSLTGV